MTRTCKKLPLEGFVKANQESLQGLPCNSSLYIDSNERDDILEIINHKKNQTRWRIILIHILKNVYNEHVYKREPHGLTAMKFGSSGNVRIYCKEYPSIYGKKIVMSHLYTNKDFQKASNKKIKYKLESISQYEYTFENK